MKTLRLSIFLSMVGLTLLLAGCSRSVSGTYRGTVANTSYDIPADLYLTLTQQGDMIGGSMTIGAPLSGGGPVSGFKKGNRFQFTTSDGVLGRITWFGTMEGRKIGGTYVVEPGAMGTLFTGSGKQQGIWVAER